MLFVTNRTPREGSQSQIGRKVSFDLQNTSVSPDIYFCSRNAKDDYIEIGHTDFFQQLKHLPEQTQVLLYIHGFNNTGEAEVFPNAEELQTLLNEHGGEHLAYVVPIIWPCDDDSILAFLDDYWDDQRAADASGFSFSRLLGKFDQWRKQEAAKPDPCTRRINTLAHSMGNRVLRNTLVNWAKYESPQMPQLFRNIFMVAADVVNHTLEQGQPGELISDAARNVIVYYANDDLAMPASKLANLKNRTVSRRLGMTGPESLKKLPRNVYEVDCDNFNNTFDKPKGHSYFLSGPNNKVSPALLHMAEAMRTGRVIPDKRHHVL